MLLTGCYTSSLTVVGPATGVASGKISETVASTSLNYVVKKQTGKTPLEHAIAYAEEKNPAKKKEPCLSFIESTRTEFCTIAKKQISSANNAVKEKALTVAKKFSSTNKIRDIILSFTQIL